MPGCRLLAAIESRYHAGVRRLEYVGVEAFDLGLLPAPALPPMVSGALGDWLEDEVRLSATGSVVHEIRFSNGGRWEVSCRTFHYRLE